VLRREEERMQRLIYSKVNQGPKKMNTSQKEKPKDEINYPEFKVPDVAVTDTMFEQSLLTEIINARLAPSSFIKDFEAMKKLYEGKVMHKKKFSVQRQEGVEAIDRAIQFLHSINTSGESFRLSKGLSQASRELCDLSNDKTGLFVDDKLVNKHGTFYGQMQQYLALMNNSPREIVLEWILDDGNQNGEHRNLLFSNEFKFIGIASGPHKDHQRITCVILVSEFDDHTHDGDNKQNVQNVTPPPSGSHTYGDIVVEGLQPVHNENATLLKMNNFGCDLSQITIEVHNDGSELYIKRNVMMDGVHTDLVTRIKLPDKVTHNSTSATYNKAEKNGELIFRMGQVINDFVGEHDICDFTIEGDESSTKDSLDFDITQTNDSFVFLPKEKVKQFCRVTALLDGNNLKFVVTHDDVTKIRTIKIPVPISPEQVKLEDNIIGKKITIFKKPHITDHQPDFTITLTEVHH